ncbi:Kelch repeat-containing protein [Parapedobacter tibetensis]|uniref:Kelch repeat-containing protein n=1 Tax=Parapedobacter tibetensis TaxID=2972951 RepID=UPI00214D744E|nr:kelch repeat-containing protein [Parapedobacter tibetensis]
MNKAWLKKLLVLVMVSAVVSACSSSDDDDPDEWARVADFEGVPRSGAAGFTIGDYFYLTTGYGTNSNRFTDTWRYNPSQGTWTRMADFPGEARNNAVAFVAGGKGYVGLGTNSTVMFKDFYEYDPSADTWTRIADFQGGARYGAVAFTLNGMGYVGTGRDIDAQDYNDFYSYSPGTDAWTKVNSTPSKRSFAFSFVLGDLVYLGGGTNNNQNVSTFYTFDGTTWTEKEPLAGRDDDYTYNLVRLSPAAFVLDGHAYLACGLSSYNGSAVGTTWRYVVSGDYWEEHQYFGGSYRQQAVNFVLNGAAYVATGRNGTVPFDDMWRFIPNPW